MRTVDYSRQQPIDLSVPRKVIVVGCGGVGSWVAFDLAQVGVQELVLIDPDIIEPSNLNRTPFRESDVGKPKVVALATLIAERRSGCVVTPFSTRAENIPPFAMDDVMKNNPMCVDCRDEVSVLPKPFPQSKIIGGYDGRNFTLHVNPDMETVFSNSQVTYTMIPSYIAVPQMLAALIVDYMINPKVWIKNETVRSTNMDELFGHLLKQECDLCAVPPAETAAAAPAPAVPAPVKTVPAKATRKTVKAKAQRAKA